MRNLRSCLKRQLPTIYPEAGAAECEVALALGGPSLEMEWDRLVGAVRDGALLFTVNGSYNYCLERGLEPRGFAMLDMRPENVRFLSNPKRSCRYFLSSSCDPGAFDALEGYQVYMFHCMGSRSRQQILRRYYFGRPIPMVDGGVAIGTRTLSLLQGLGFRKVQAFGFDSCIMEGRHHAYPQEDNDDYAVDVVRVGEQEFLCQRWMADEAYCFIMWAQHSGRDMQLQVHGNGLIATILAQASEKKAA